MSEVTPRPTSDLFPASFHLPSWWVHAYETVALSADYTTSIDRAKEMGILPFSDPRELYALVFVIDALQNQAMSQVDDSQTLCISPKILAKNAGTTSKAAEALLNRVAIMASQMQLITLQQDHSENQFRLEPLFVNEQWQLRQTKESELYVKPSKKTVELLFGYLNPYAEMKRAGNKESRLAPVFRSKPPLSLWRSAWLDLSGYEQVLFFLMEKAFQWQKKCVQFDGILVEDLSELFAVIDSKLRKKSLNSAEEKNADKKVSYFLDNLRLIKKLGMTLYEHGYLKSKLGHCDFEFGVGFGDGRRRSMELLWQLSPERLLNEETKRLCSKVVTKFAMNEAELALCLDVLTCGIDLSPYESGITKFITNISEGKIREPLHLVIPGTSELYYLPYLFLEWTIRLLPGHILGLPDALQQSRFVKACDGLVRNSDLTQDFELFVQEIKDRSAQFLNLTTDPLFSLAAAQSLKDPLINKIVVAQFDRVKNSRTLRPGPVSVNKLPETRPSKLAPLPPAQIVREIQSPKLSSTGVQEETKNSATSKMRRIALEELEGIIKSNSEQYETLKKLYFSTLDEGTIKLITEVQQQMRRDLFENHIKRRLVDFMLQNPNAWKSATAGYREPKARNLEIV